MLICSSGIGKNFPREYRSAAEALFSVKKAVTTQEAFLQSCEAFADKLGVGAEYRRFDMGWDNPEKTEKLFNLFNNNLELVVQKTWVEKVDEDRKENLLNRIPGFISGIKEGDYVRALKEFGVMLDELAWLLFGSQSGEKDFNDYVFRIDHQLGLFWWYGGQLEQFLSSGQHSKESLRAVLLLGLCYLTGF